MKNILVINGPNINMLGKREPEIYGTKTYADLVDFIENAAEEIGVKVQIFQSNHEGEIIDKIQQALGSTISNTNSNIDYNKSNNTGSNTNDNTDSNTNTNSNTKDNTDSKIDGIIINPAAYTHTSIAIPDALKAVGIPAIEVHLTDITNREEYRKHSYTSEACIKTITGKGFDSYKEALKTLAE